MSSRLRVTVLAALTWTRRAVRKSDRLLDGLIRRVSTPDAERAVHIAGVRRASAAHDMARHPDEAYYARIYLDWIRAGLAARAPGRLLDVGCGQGRIAVALALATPAEVVAVDVTPAAVDRARAYARDAGAVRLRIECRDALEFLRAEADASYDAVTFLEVAFFMPEYREVLAEIARVLRPGGQLFASFWSLYYRTLAAVRAGDWETAHLLLEERQGRIGGGGTRFTWHTGADVRALLAPLGFRDVRIAALGPCSGIEGDPLAVIAQPSRLSNTDRAELEAIEAGISGLYPDVGRYILACATKGEHQS